VCGLRAVAIARKDFQALTEAASVYSAHLWEVPQQARKSIAEIKAGQKARQRLLEEVAELEAANFLRVAHERPSGSGQKLVVKYFADRDLAFIKLLAQKIVRLDKAVALLACGGAQPALVFAQSSGLPNDMGALMKESLEKLGMRGGGNRDMAQGGAPDSTRSEHAIHEAASTIG
jgi:alanyl-tRNA synthetase